MTDTNGKQPNRFTNWIDELGRYSSRPIGAKTMPDEQLVARLSNDPMHHDLKTDPDYFAAVWSGDKTFEYRRDDRFFKVGDTMTLHETTYSSIDMKMNDMPLQYTGRMISTTITYILRLDNGYAILGFKNDLK